MTRNLFAYGTLRIPEIWDLVVGKSYHNEPATLPGHEIRTVRGGGFPGIFATDAEGTEIPGRVFFDLNEESITRLDAYEDAFYERIPVSGVISETTGEVSVCESYVVTTTVAARILSEKTWTLEWFEREAKADYIARLKRAL